jgi:hypothetical protein
VVTDSAYAVIRWLSGLQQLRHRLASQRHLDEGVVRQIFRLSELAAAAHAVVFPFQDVLTTLLRVGPPVVSENEIPYFRDIRDHAEHVSMRLSHAQNMADRAFDIYHALENRSQAAVSKQLTQVATVFLPLSFFGQNFGFLTLVFGLAALGPEPSGPPYRLLNGQRSGGRGTRMRLRLARFSSSWVRQAPSSGTRRNSVQASIRSAALVANKEW